MAHPVDAHIGRRILNCRSMLGMTQSELADRCGVKLWQIHKYEVGTCHISVGDLWAIGNALKVPTSYFFEGLARASSVGVPTPAK